MYFQYGGYAHPAGEVQVTSYSVESKKNDRGIVISKVYTMQLAGIIVASGDVAIDARIAEIQNAYSLDGYNAALIRTDGRPSHLCLDSGSSLYGVQVTSGPTFPMERDKAHFATGLPYSITLEAEYGTPNVNSPFIGSTETIEQIGDGGPISVITTLDNGKPVIDIVSPASPVIVTQSGEATYELLSVYPPVYPYFNPPLWPENLVRPDGYRPSRTRSRPKKGKVQYKAAWSYTYHFTEPPFIPNPSA